MRWLIGIAVACVAIAGLYYLDTDASERAYHARLATGGGIPEITEPDYRDAR
jgi:hypothetical protein